MTRPQIPVTLIVEMGNDHLSSKYKILRMLRTAHEPMSGEEIAGEAGISRVSVWKAVRSLQEAGYGINSTRNGYFLEKDLDDSLFPWEFGAEEEFHLHFPETGSTMTEARKIAETEAQTNSPRGKARIVTADAQTHGRGRSGRTWTTTRGSLACTVITQTKLPVAESHRLTMAAQIAAVNALNALTASNGRHGKQFFVRWPNDIWSADGKVGGVLDDLSATGSVCNWMNLGIGINMNSRPRIANADSIAKNTRGRLSRRRLLSLFQAEFKTLERHACEATGALASEWDSLCYDNGKAVRLLSDKRVYIFKGISALGFALLESPDGGMTRIAPGSGGFVKA